MSATLATDRRPDDDLRRANPQPDVRTFHTGEAETQTPQTSVSSPRDLTLRRANQDLSGRAET